MEQKILFPTFAKDVEEQFIEMSRIKEITLHKEFKKNMGNFSNMTVGTHITWEVGKDEEFSFPDAWDTINRELQWQAGNLDQEWINIYTKEYKNHITTTIRQPKTGGGDTQNE